MRLLSKIFGSSRKIGNTDPVCPYCSVTLEKMPGRKKRCPECKNDIYVRTRPKDNRKILIRSDEILAVEEQWSIKNGTHKQFVVEQRRRRTYARNLAKKFGREPSENDIEWALLNDDAMAHASRNDWGLYRNARFSMAKILKQEGKSEQYIRFMLEVCYIDLNGPNNCGGIDDPAILREYPPFNPKDGILAPGIVGPLSNMARDLDIKISDLHSMFIEIASQVQISLKLKLPPDKAWRKLKKEVAT